MQTQRSLRVLLVTNNYTPYTGGVVNSLQVTIDALRALGHKPLLVTLDFARTTFETDVIRLYCPIKFHYYGNAMALPLCARTQLLYIIKQFCPDVIHVQHPFLLGSHALSLARALSIPALFTYHTQYHEQAHYVPLPRFLAVPLIAHHVRHFCNKCDLVIMPTSMVQKRCDSWLQVPTCVIPSGIDERYYYPYARKVPSSVLQLLTIGRMVPEKRVTILLDAASMLEIDYRLTLIGYGYQYDYLQNYAYQIKKLSAEQVQFIHQPSKEMMAAWYAKADLFLFAAPHDTQGLVLAEAMASSTPVIALPGPGQQEIVQNGYNGYIVQSVEEMVATIRMLSKQSSLLQQLQEGAWQTAQSYRPQICTQQLVDVYQSIL